ncbi:MAG: HAMP domain-containing histidine kinase, partial [Labilithrix sp.]|nr:HAMP domain-containing histidine kinase [Labilithrix sp.]
MTDRDDEDKPESQRGDPHRDLAGVLHDVSNALTVLLGWVGEARAADATPETTAYALTIVEQRARIARDLARHAIGSPRIDEQLPAGEIAREVVDALAVEASRVGATMLVNGADALAKVAGALDVSQVLTNLVMNALAYAPRGSEVTVDVTADDERVAIVVADQGPGVPESRRDGIFRGAS